MTIMPRRRRTREEILERAKIARRKRYENIKSDPVLYALQREKERQRYLKRKEEKKNLSIGDMTPRARRQQRKKWRENFNKFYNKKLLRNRGVELMNANSPSGSDSEDLPGVDSAEVNSVQRYNRSQNQRVVEDPQPSTSQAAQEISTNEELKKKIIPLCTFLALLAVPTLEQDSGSTPISPCPNVFRYEPPGSEPGRWYGEVNLSTDSTLHSLWLNIVLDNKADILGNWIGDVSTTDNKDFKIENGDMQINPGPAVPVRFFVQYNPLNETPKLVTIRLNGREICNANSPRPAVNRPDEDNVRRPTPQPNFGFETKPVNRDPPKESPRPYFQQSHATEASLNIPSGDRLNQNRPDNGYQATPRPDGRPRPSVSEPADQDYWTGPAYIQLPKLDTSNSNSPGGQSQCGKVVLNPIPLVVNGTPTLVGQWPWQIALYQTQTVDNKYICGGTLVTHKHVITAAHCVTRKMSQRLVDPNTLTIYLGKHNLRTSVEGVQIKFVKEIIVNPNYNSSLFSRDVAILELREPVTYSDYVRPACLWPDNEVDLKNVIGKKGSVVGWGFDETGVATEELSLVEMPVVSQETCIRSYSEFFARFTSDYTYCAGYRDGTSVCNGDSGGGMVFRMNGIWYLRGLVSLSVARPNEYRCDPTHYVIFTDLAKFLPWIYATVSDF